MRKSLPIFLLFLSAILYSQHKVDAAYHIDSATEIRMLDYSNMLTGNVKEDYIIMQNLVEGEDGEVSLTVNGFNASNENIKITLVDPDNIATYFGMRLSNNVVTIEQNYNGQLEELEVGVYEVGYKFRVIRCQNQITYYINSTMVDVFDLVDNNFKLAGEFDVVSGTNIDFDASIEFNKN